MSITVIGIGQGMRGDDGVGIAVLEHLRTQCAPRLPTSAILTEVHDPTTFVEVLQGVDLAVVVDAMVSDLDPGQVRRLLPGSIATDNAMPLSTHGIGVIEAIQMARWIAPETTRARVVIVGVSITRPHVQPSPQMSAAVAAAVPLAAAEVLDILAEWSV